MLIRPANIQDHSAIVALNAAEVQHTSGMDAARLRELDELSAYHRVVEIGQHCIAFLLAMREGCSYNNENYRWFSHRFERFIYIDRIVVAKAYAGQGVGSKMYQDVFAYARKQNVEKVTCEYNLVPENVPSSAFHHKLGFCEIGARSFENNSRKVSMQAVNVNIAL